MESNGVGRDGITYPLFGTYFDFRGLTRKRKE